MNRKVSILLLVGGLLLAACNRTAGTPTTQPAAEAFAGASPTPVAAMPTPVATAHPPTPTSTITPAPLPNLEAEGTLPALYGRLDDPAALIRALQVGEYATGGELWIASLPSPWPAALPLPTQGEPLLTERLAYTPDEAWTVLWRVPATDAAAWWQAYHETLAAAGWTAESDFPPRGSGFTAPSVAGLWDWLCSPDGAWSLNLAAIAAEGDTWARLGFHRNPAEGGGPCGDGGPAMPPEGLLPALSLPEGARVLAQSGGGGIMLGLESQVTFETTLEPAAAVAAFTEQLQAQGWTPEPMQTGALWGMPAGYVRARRTTDRGEFGLHLLVWGATPRLTAWMGAYDTARVQATPPPAMPDRGLATIHPGQADVETLRQALRLWHWQAFTAAPPQVWVGVAPSPWPWDALPQPPDAAWIKVVAAEYPGSGETAEPSQHWSLFFEVPQDPAAARAALQALLIERGWTRQAGLPDPGPRLRLDTSPGYLEEVWCTADASWSLMQMVLPTDAGSLVMWIVDSEGPCLWQEGKGIPAGPEMAASMPALRLTPPEGGRAREGGMTWDYGPAGRARGVAAALWWTPVEPAALRASLAEQLAEQGWEVTAQDTWPAGLVWLQARHPGEEESGAWQARVLALPMPNGWVWMRVAVEAQP